MSPTSNSFKSSLHSTAASAAAERYGSGAGETSTELQDVLEFHILTRLDGPTLASTSCTSSLLRALSTQENLWTNICHSAWPSTDEYRLREVISRFPQGHRSFFSDSYPLIINTAMTSNHRPSPDDGGTSSPDLISAVDIHYRGEPIFSRVVETETATGWFRCSPFRIDMLEPKDVVPTPARYPVTDDGCSDLGEDLTLSWILIDPVGRRAMNLSSRVPVSVNRHWLSGEVHARFATVLAGEKGSASEFVQCGVVVTCGGSQGGDLQVREVSLQVDDLDGMFLTGKDSLVILRRALEGKRGNSAGREDGGKRMHEEFLRMKRERKERKLRTEGTLDMICAVVGVLTVGLVLVFSLFR